MASVINDDVRIHYEVAGAGPPVLLIHAFSGSHKSWEGYGFVERLQAHHQLIMPDLRGHGASDAPERPEAYSIELIAADLVAVLDDLGLEEVHALGYSMGGLAGFALARDHPGRLRSLAVGGASPYPPQGGAARSVLLEFYERAAREGVESLVESIRQWAGGISPAYEARLRAANVRAGAACLRRMQERPPDFSTALPSLKLPCLLYTGEADDLLDAARRAAEALPQGRFVALPGMNPVQAAGASEELAPLLRAFWGQEWGGG